MAKSISRALEAESGVSEVLRKDPELLRFYNIMFPKLYLLGYDDTRYKLALAYKAISEKL